MLEMIKEIPFGYGNFIPDGEHIATFKRIQNKKTKKGAVRIWFYYDVLGSEFADGTNVTNPDGSPNEFGTKMLIKTIRTLGYTGNDLQEGINQSIGKKVKLTIATSKGFQNIKHMELIE